MQMSRSLQSVVYVPGHSLVQTREAVASDAKNTVSVVRPGGAQAWHG